MNYFRISLETGKKQNLERILFVRASNIIAAMDISKKIRGSTLKSIAPISFENYMKGVSKKYDQPTKKSDKPNIKI